MKIGKIDISKLTTPPLKSEFLTAKFLATKGKDIEFIPPSQIAHSRTPDIVMEGLKWEIKNPRKNGKYTLDHAMKSALKQSNYVIFDLRKCDIPEQTAVNKLKKDFDTVKKLKRLKIITKSQKLLHFDK